MTNTEENIIYLASNTASLERQITLISKQIAELAAKEANEGLNVKEENRLRSLLNQLNVNRNKLKKAQIAEAAEKSIVDTDDDVDVEEMAAKINASLDPLFEKYNPYYINSSQTYVFQSASAWEDDDGKMVFKPARHFHVRKGNLNQYHPPLEIKSANPSWLAFVDRMHNEDRIKFDITFSFNKTPSDTLNLMNRNFLPFEDFLDAEPYHWFFDTVLRDALGGDRDDNADHLEKAFIAAYFHPETNFIRPCQVFDDEGGTGKTLFATTALSVLFGSDKVIPSMDIKNIEGFNTSLAGKVVVCINEVTHEPGHANILRRTLGTEKIRIEPKGVDAYYADNFALYLISGNNRGIGTVNFTGTGVDRRYSMHCPKTNLAVILSKVLTEKTGTVHTKEQADAWIRTTGQYIMRDPIEVSRWFASIVLKHGIVSDLEPLHGDDYHKIVESQKPTFERIFSHVFSDPNFTYVKKKTLYEFFQNEDKSSKMKRETFYKYAEDYISKNKLPIIKKAVRWGESSAEIFYNDSLKIPVTVNDNLYFTKDSYGRVHWQAELPA